MAGIYGEVDFKRAPAERDGIVLKQEIGIAIKASLPELGGLISEALEELLVVTRRFFLESNNPAGVIIGNHAINDFDGLVDALLLGDGRNAARISRSLYEHLINYCDVMTSTPFRERYLAHKSVTAELLSKQEHGLALLKGPQQKRERARLYKIGRDSAKDLTRALASFGSAFRRGWAIGSLRDRAIGHGYGDQYDTYKLLSQVTHGSCGGVLGTYADVSGSAVHRTGPSLDLAVICYLEGLSFARDFFSEIKKKESIDTGTLVRSLNALIVNWPAYKSVLQAIDRDIWPKDPPPHPVAIMAMYPNSRIRWYYWEPALNVMKLAIPPNDATWIEQGFRDRLRENPNIVSPDLDGRPITSAVSGVQVTPAPGSKWFRADAILIPAKKVDQPSTTQATSSDRAHE